MPDKDGGNGKQRQLDQLKTEDKHIHEKLDDLKTSVKDLDDKFTKFIAPNGPCDRHRSIVSRMAAQVRFQWWTLGIVVTMLAGIAGLAIRYILTGG